MKKKLIPLVRERAKENRSGLYIPRVLGDKKMLWPVCMTCHQDVEAVNVEDLSAQEVVIRAFCHGKEAVLKVEFPYRILKSSDNETFEHVNTAIRSALFFDPSIA
jgi:hypothetical protein